MSVQPKMCQKRILLADEQRDVRGVIQMMVDLAGHSVAEAANGRGALALFAPGRFDVVVTDYAMPEMAGDELARKIKGSASSQAVLMGTGSGQLPRGVEMAVDAVLAKPFTLRGLLQAVEQLCPVPAHLARKCTLVTGQREKRA